jgi:competence protein ComEA
MLKKLLAIMALVFYAATAFASVDVNTASAADLGALKGIGPAITGRIIAARPFKDWNDFIARVKGIGRKNAAKFSAEGLTVGGASLQGAPAIAAKHPQRAKKPKAASVAQ